MDRSDGEGDVEAWPGGVLHMVSAARSRGKAQRNSELNESAGSRNPDQSVVLGEDGSYGGLNHFRNMKRKEGSEGKTPRKQKQLQPCSCGREKVLFLQILNTVCFERMKLLTRPA